MSISVWQEKNYQAIDLQKEWLLKKVTLLVFNIHEWSSDERIRSIKHNRFQKKNDCETGLKVVNPNILAMSK